MTTWCGVPAAVAHARVADVDYSAPLWLRLAAGSVCSAGGVATAALFSAALGDATWSVSTGIGVCMAAGVYELGRPSRLSVGEAAALEAQWQDFGECHCLCGAACCSQGWGVGVGVFVGGRGRQWGRAYSNHELEVVGFGRRGRGRGGVGLLTMNLAMHLPIHAVLDCSTLPCRWMPEQSTVAATCQQPH
jgi:hypothetical protein